jgi:hypothetical protein
MMAIPTIAGAKLLEPSYTLKDTIAAKIFTFSTTLPAEQTATFLQW